MFFKLKRDPGPMMRLHLGHRDDEVGIENGARHPQLSESAVIGFQLHSLELVAVQIDELDLPFVEMRRQTRGLHYEFSVALMSRAFADHHTGGAKTKKGSCGCADKSRARVHGSRLVIHLIWFEENCLAKHLQMEEPQSVHEEELQSSRSIRLHPGSLQMSEVSG